MKNQYFGDNRDLFKYDLVLQVVEADLVSHFTFIPMLTEHDGSKQGGETSRNKAKAGTKNGELVKFLNKCIEEQKRDIKQLENFFKKKGIKMTICKKDEYFRHEDRTEYFKQIGNEVLSKSLVFVDPDIGLQVNRSREKHILYCEAQSLYNRMDTYSVLMIFQFIPRKKRKTYFTRISKKLQGEVGNRPIYISDNQVVFFFLAKDKSLRKSLAKTISDYKRCYPKLSIGNIR